MDLTSPTNIKNLLSKYDARASKGLGQNFLIDKNILQKITDSSNLSPNDFIVEVGPGIGTLTKELAQRAKKVLAVEKDKKMVEVLKETLASFKNTEIISADILKYEALNFNEEYKLIANLPYYITSPVIRKFLEEKQRPRFMVLMVQKEVAQRICSKPPEMSLLAVSVQFYAAAEIVSYVSKNCFWPSPKVDSAIIKITPQKNQKISPELFFEVAKSGFAHPRKQLVNNLLLLKTFKGVKLDKYIVSEWLLKNKINPNQRAETLPVEKWIDLANNF